MHIITYICNSCISAESIFTFWESLFVRYDIDKANILLTSRFTDSMTSMNTSFFLYLMPSDRQDTALVTVAGGRGAPTSNLWPFWVMYLKDEKEVKTFQKLSEFLLRGTPEETLIMFKSVFKTKKSLSSLPCFRKRHHFPF